MATPSLMRRLEARPPELENAGLRSARSCYRASTRVALIILAVLLVGSRPAAAWSPGPLPFEHCVKTFDVAARGVVTKVENVATKPGGWVLSRATLDVERLYFGITPVPKQLTFYFWSSTSGELSIAHALAAKD